MDSEKSLPQASAFILEEQTDLTLDEVSSACAVEAESIVELVDEGALAPVGPAPHRWRFSGSQLYQAKVAMRLQRDLGVNPAGAALALDLIDELEVLRVRLKKMGGK